MFYMNITKGIIMLNPTDNNLVFFHLWEQHERAEPTAHMFFFFTLGAATVSDGLYWRVPAVASSPRASEHIRTHSLFIWAETKSAG